MNAEERNNHLEICIVETQSQLTLSDLCRACAVDAERIVELVDVGVLEPVGPDQECWYFEGTSLHRARMVLRLQRDLELNLSGAALALELLNEIDALRSRLRALGEVWPPQL